MKKFYRIEVGVTPSPENNKHQPYYWVLWSSTGNSEWCNDFFGWAVSPEKAWEEAYDIYKTYKIGETI
jgi:hypothetical protein